MRKEKLTTILYIALTMIFLVGMFLYEDNHPLEDFLTEYRIEARLPDGTSFSGRALVKDIPASGWLHVERQHPASV